MSLDDFCNQLSLTSTARCCSERLSTRKRVSSRNTSPKRPAGRDASGQGLPTKANNPRCHVRGVVGEFTPT
jgi:hypothetical protein